MMENSQYQEEKLNDKVLIILAWLFGAFLGTNIVYVFSVGTTKFIISEVYSVILFIYLFSFKKIKWKRICNALQNSFILFCFSIVFSAIMVWVSFGKISLYYRYVVGIIMFFIAATAFVNIISLFEYRQYISKGIALGLIINVVICIIQYVMYQSGITFDYLYKIFVQDSFHLSIYNFGAQGMFLEPSHMIQYIGSVLPIWIGVNWEKKWTCYIVLLLTILACAFSGSGTSMVIYLTIGLFIIFSFKKFSRKVNIFSLLIVYVLLLAIIVGLFSEPIYQFFEKAYLELGQYITLALQGSNVRDASNIERANSMIEALKLIPRYPLGCGWNMVHTLLEQETTLKVASAFSDLIEMILELGVIGVSFYVFMMIKLIIGCLKKYSREAIGIAISLIAVLIMQILADYAINVCIMMILGWAMCLLTDKNEQL